MEAIGVSDRNVLVEIPCTLQQSLSMFLGKVLLTVNYRVCGQFFNSLWNRSLDLNKTGAFMMS